MEIDEDIISSPNIKKDREITKIKKDKEITRLLDGFKRFFNSKFSPENYNTNPTTSEGGYHIIYLNVDYSFDFSHEGSPLNPKSGNLIFNLKADIKKKDDNLEQRLNENKFSNHQLDKTKYLTNQKINSNGEYVNVYCKIKKTPKDDGEINDFCFQLWDYIIKNVFAGIHKV